MAGKCVRSQWIRHYVGPATCCVVDLGPALRCQWAQETLNNICLKLPVAFSGRNRVTDCMVVESIACSAFGVALPSPCGCSEFDFASSVARLKNYHPDFAQPVQLHPHH